MTARARFTQADLRRAAAGTMAAGLGVARIEIDRDGKIVIIPGAPDKQAGNDNAWADLEK